MFVMAVIRNIKETPVIFWLTPPAAHRRADKSLCDGVGVVSRDVAIGLLKAGIGKGLISEQLRGGWPQNIWSVTDDGEPLEAELENSVTGTYHGYPMPKADPLRNEVLKKWHAS